MGDLAIPSDNGAVADNHIGPLLPDFLKPTTEIDLRRPLLPRVVQGFSKILGIAAAKPNSGKLARPFFLEKQLQTNWCWASVGVALNKFFQRPAVTQCQLVQRTRNPAGVNCCTAPGSAQCNATEFISKVFTNVGLTRRSPQPEGAIEFGDIKADIAANCPIVCAMQGGGTVHFVVIVGWAVINGVQSVVVDDPAVGGRLQRPLGAFATNFNGRRWAQSTRLAR